MCLRNTVNSYGVVAKIFHWGMAILIICLLILGLSMESYEKTPEFGTLIGLHKEFGALVLILVCFRLIWKMTNISPPLPENMNKPLKLLAKLGHLALYGFMFALPLSGWVLSNAAGHPVSVFGLFDLPNLVAPDKDFAHNVKELHGLLADGLMVLLAVHILAALLHHFYYKDNILRHMLPFVKNNVSI